jgi:PmbA protein
VVADDFPERALAAAQTRGFDAAAVKLISTEEHELNAEFGHPNLLRTNHNDRLSLVGIIDGKRGSVNLNNAVDDTLDAAVEELWSVAQASLPDDANAIAPAQPASSFASGPEAADYELMYERIVELLAYAHTNYPTLNMRQAIVSFIAGTERFVNSNGVDLTSRENRYGAGLTFAAKEGTNVSSFNGIGFALSDLSRPLHQCATADVLMRQATEQVHTKRIPAAFKGDLLITPDCLGDFISFLTQNIASAALIAGNSIYLDKLGEQVAADGLTMHSQPRSVTAGYAITADGFVAEDTAIVQHGKLKSYLLDLYGANKTGLPRARSGGGCYVVAPGSQSLDELISEIDQGILISRFSGGRPNNKGDFSGIAKNSYYISGGEIIHPVAETMISGNMAASLQNITGLSAERADFGYNIYPWVRVAGVGVS